MTRPSLRVLWLCAGNICRSPCFEAALRDEAIRQGIERRVSSVSAGVAPWCGGKPAHRDMVAAASAAGIHIGPRTSQRLSVSLLSAANLVVPLDAAVRRTLLDDFGRNQPLTVRGPGWFGLPADDVPDPYGKPAEAFAAVAALAVDAARHLCLRLRAGDDLPAGRPPFHNRATTAAPEAFPIAAPRAIEEPMDRGEVIPVRTYHKPLLRKVSIRLATVKI